MPEERKLKILIGCLLFKDFTGSEMYVYELSKNLLKLNCDVTIVSPYIGGKLTDLALKCGIKVEEFSNIKRNENYDIIHCQHKPVVEELIKIFPNTKKVCSIHSEVISLEDPVFHNSIKKYIAIRPEIKKHLLNNNKMSPSSIEVIYNPIDETRFQKIETKNHNSVLFVGTIDYLRKNTIFDLVEYTKSINKDFWLVGNNSDNYLGELLKNKHVKYSNAVEDVQKYVQRCDETSGILLGRTTVEGWMCGKPGWIYDVNNKGDILSKKLHNPPDDLNKFYGSNVAKQIKELYFNI
jgi:glycosyltransferase involved in cell wall biosynthesis